MNAETVRRYALTACAFVFVTCLIGGLFQANVQEWAKATGNDQWMVQYAGVAMANLAATAQTSWFIAVTAFLVGGSVFLWADYFLRGKSKALPQVDTPPSAEDFPEPPAPKKFYSSKEREVFASALFDLRDICKRDGERIVQNVGTFLKDWSSRRSEVSEGKPFEGPYVLQFIDLIRGQIDNFQLSIYSPDGVLGRNPAFPELKECVGVGAGTIQDLRIALSHFECAVRVAEKIEDKQSLGMMTWMVMSPIRDNLATAQSKFGGWLSETDDLVRAREEGLRV